jgi:formylglycine-generating enzyme required for sulfatase activity
MIMYVKATPAVCVLSVLLIPTVIEAGEPVVRRDMVYISGGEFIMGTNKAEARRLAAEHGVHPTLFHTEVPQRKVTVQPFLIDRFPVTNAQYKAFIDDTRHRPPSHWGGRNVPKGLIDHPVTCVG